MSRFELHLGDCLETLRTMPDNSVDSIVTDPPYGLEFMGKDWDAPWKQVSGGFSKPGIGDRNVAWPSFTGSNLNRCETCGMLIGQGGSRCKCDAPKPRHSGGDRMRLFQTWVTAWAAECLRVLKPGGYLLAFAGTRTHHRMCAGIEDAGFEIRDMIAWVYGSGFPKSLDVSKAIDKAAGAEREVVGIKTNYHSEGRRAGSGANQHGVVDGSFSNPDAAAQITAPATEAARQWTGWGTALKPALEPITVARKPLIGTVAENVLVHGTGALNIDGCRIGHASDEDLATSLAKNPGRADTVTSDVYGAGRPQQSVNTAGRWPANLIHDGSEEAVAGFPVTGPSSGAPRINRSSESIGTFVTSDRVTAGVSDSGGSAARFFYCAKASKRDRDEGLEGFEVKRCGSMEDDGYDWEREKERGRAPRDTKRANIHPTVKPTDLMAYLCRLVTPPGGVVLDPFMGSGSTGKAAMREGFRFIGCEMSPEYLEIARARIESALKVP